MEARDPLFGVAGRVAVVTGASSGLGERFARVLRERGADVVLASRRAERLSALATELDEDHAEAFATDVTDENAMRALLERAAKRFGRLDIMVNNAGISDDGRPKRSRSRSSNASSRSTSQQFLWAAARRPR